MWLNKVKECLLYTDSLSETSRLLTHNITIKINLVYFTDVKKTERAD